jgi:hypothetical protein
VKSATCIVLTRYTGSRSDVAAEADRITIEVERKSGAKPPPQASRLISNLNRSLCEIFGHRALIGSALLHLSLKPNDPLTG